MEAQKRYVCAACDDEFEAMSDAITCCGAYEAWVCAECGERHDEENEAEDCCS